MRAVAGAAETLRVLLSAAFEVLFHFDNVLFLKRTNRALHLALGHRHHRVSGCFLIARVGERIQGHWVLIGCYQGLFDQAADNTGLGFIQYFRHGLSLAGGEMRRMSQKQQEVIFSDAILMRVQVDLPGSIVAGTAAQRCYRISYPKLVAE